MRCKIQIVRNCLIGAVFVLSATGTSIGQSAYNDMLFLNQMNDSNCTGSGGTWSGMSCSGGNNRPRKLTREERELLQRLSDEYWGKMAKESECLVILGKPDTLENTQALIKHLSQTTGRQNVEIYADLTNGLYVASIGMGTPGYDGWPSITNLKRRGLIPPQSYCVKRRNVQGVYVKREVDEGNPFDNNFFDKYSKKK